jgi:hypothetical protein
MKDFNALEWCDATLLAINIDRSNLAYAMR